MERFYSEAKGKWVQHFMTEPNAAVTPHGRANAFARKMGTSSTSFSKSREASPTMMRPAAVTQGYAGWCAD